VINGAPVLVNGGSFDTITNGACFTNMTFAITDATGLTIPSASSPTITNQPGTFVPPPPTPAPALVVAPSSVTGTGCAGKTFQFLVTGGTAPYSAFTTPSAGVVTVSGGTVSVSGLATGSGATTLVIGDSSSPGKSLTATLTCS